MARSGIRVLVGECGDDAVELRAPRQLRRLWAHKVWLALRCEGIDVARCTVERLMRTLGLHGTRRGNKRRHHDP